MTKEQMKIISKALRLYVYTVDKREKISLNEALKFKTLLMRLKIEMMK